MEETIGGRRITQTNLTQYTTTLPFSPTIATCPTVTDPAALCIWDDIPDKYTTTIRMQHAGIDYTINAPDLSGKRLTLTYAGSDNHPELRLEGYLLPPPGTATTPGSATNCNVIINHPYPAPDGLGNPGKYQDQTVLCQPISGKTYAIVYNFGASPTPFCKKGSNNWIVTKPRGLPTAPRLFLARP